MVEKSNQPTPDLLAAMPVADLYEYRAQCLSWLEEAKTALGEVDKVVDMRCREAVTIGYELAGKQHGTVRAPLNATGFEAVGNVSKKVEWDQDKLKAVAAAMDWPTVNHFFKITFSVPEKVYAGLPPDDPRKAAFDAARTVQYGEPKITLEKKEG